MQTEQAIARSADRSPECELGLHEIMALLPHRAPFLMIDRVVDIMPGVSAIGLKAVTASECFLPPDGPRDIGFPRVLMLEAMAQTAAVLALHGQGAEIEGATAYFLGIEDATFDSGARPGDVLKLRVRLEHNRGPVSKFRAFAVIRDHVVARAMFLAAVVGASSAA